MRAFLILAFMTLAVGALTPRLADHFLPKSATPKAAAVVPPRSAPGMPTGPRTVVIPRDNRGHFQVDGVIDGRRIGFLVDTGASLVILTQRDAARLGFHPTAREHTAVVNTANGKVRAAPVKLAMVRSEASWCAMSRVSSCRTRR